MRVYLGIDPGLSGGIAVINQIGEVVSVTKMPQTMPDIYNYLNDVKVDAVNDGHNIVCYMEKVGFGMPNQSSKATATFSRHCGHLEMALLALQIPVVEVSPNKWMKTLGIGSKGSCEKNVWKNKLKSVAQMRFPQLGKKVTLATCDALLLANYGLQMDGVK